MIMGEKSTNVATGLTVETYKHNTCSRSWLNWLRCLAYRATCVRQRDDEGAGFEADFRLSCIVIDM